MKYLYALFIGAIFGIGIAISGMANPAKVINFFDIAGSWDPSLIFVMGGALTVTALGYRMIFAKRSKPLLADGFSLPTRKDIDFRLVAGSATFGIGWGIAGFCPGAAIPTLGLGHPETLLFLGGVILGIVVARILNARLLAASAAT